jgi:hypothetical protein
MRHRSHVLFPLINEVIRHPKILDAIEDLSTQFGSVSVCNLT